MFTHSIESAPPPPLLIAVIGIVVEMERGIRERLLVTTRRALLYLIAGLTAALIGIAFGVFFADFLPTHVNRQYAAVAFLIIGGGVLFFTLWPFENTKIWKKDRNSFKEVYSFAPITFFLIVGICTGSIFRSVLSLVTEYATWRSITRASSNFSPRKHLPLERNFFSRYGRCMARKVNRVLT